MQPSHCLCSCFPPPWIHWSILTSTLFLSASSLKNYIANFDRSSKKARRLGLDYIILYCLTELVSRLRFFFFNYQKVLYKKLFPERLGFESYSDRGWGSTNSANHSRTSSKRQSVSWDFFHPFDYKRHPLLARCRYRRSSWSWCRDCLQGPERT